MEDEASEGSCESESQADDAPDHYWSDDGDDPYDLEDPWDTPYRPMRRYTEYEDSDSGSDSPVEPALPDINFDWEVPYVNIAPPETACAVRPGSDHFEEPYFAAFPDGAYRSRVVMSAAQVVECVKHPEQHYGALAVMAEDYARSLVRFEPDRVYAAAVSRAFVDFAVRRLLGDPASKALLKIADFGDEAYAVSYRSWRRLELIYGFKP